MKIHKHWVFGRKWQENVVHPISQKHMNIDSKLRHDLEIGKLQRWAKLKGLHMMDSTYEKYRYNVLGKRR